MLCSGVNPQGLKSQKVFSERGRKTTDEKQSNSRENVTAVTTISAAGVVLPPLYICKGQCVKATWITDPVPDRSRYHARDLSFMQGAVSLEFIQMFREHIVSNNLDDGMPHIPILDGHASHVTIDLLKFAMDKNMHVFQLPLHSLHVTQPLDVCTFGIFKRNINTVLTRFSGANGMRMPVKIDMASIAFEASPLSSQSKTYYPLFRASVSSPWTWKGVSKD